MNQPTPTFSDAMPNHDHEIVAYLVSQLGLTLTAYIATARRRELLNGWATPPGGTGHTSPPEESAVRLRFAYRIFRLIQDADDNHVARAWLISANPRLDDRTPAEFVRDNKLVAVSRAAHAFASDSYYA